MKWRGFTISVIGYGVAFVGACLLFFNAPPDLGDTGAGAVTGDLRWIVAIDVKREGARWIRRRVWNRIGFAMIALGTMFQCLGSFISTFA